MTNYITQEEKNEILNLKSQGKSVEEIIDIMNMNIFKVKYWLDEEHRKKRIFNARKQFLKKNKKQRKEYYKSRREYIKNYNGRRYKEDPIFREKQKERARNYKRKCKEVL